MNFIKHFGHGDEPSMHSAPEQDFNTCRPYTERGTSLKVVHSFLSSVGIFPMLNPSYLIS